MKNILCAITAALLLSACTVDNFEKPSIRLSGRILDSETDQPVPSGGANAGTIVKLYENNSTQPLLYKTYPDGTFINEAVFPGIYRYTAEGPFRLTEPDEKNITINSNSELDIRVVPYVRLNTTVISVTGTTAEIRVQYEKVKDDDVIANLGLIYSTHPNPSIFSSSGGMVMLENVESAGLTSGEKTYTVSNLQPGKKYYIRAGANAHNPGNYYNYSTQVEIDVP